MAKKLSEKELRRQAVQALSPDSAVEGEVIDRGANLP
jgi:hypothetical protein